MRNILSFICFTSAVAVCGAVIPVDSYKFDAPTLTEARGAYMDNDFKKLTNGDVSGKSRVIWELKKVPGKVVKISFKLQDKGAEKINLDIFRGPRSYGYKTIKLFAIVDGKPVLAVEQTFNHPYQLAADSKPYEKLTVDIPENVPAANEYELHVSGTGSYIGLCEVSFEKK